MFAVKLSLAFGRNTMAGLRQNNHEKAGEEDAQYVLRKADDVCSLETARLECPMPIALTK